MKIINSPWQKEFESFIASARKELRIAAPYYGEETIRTILKRSKADTRYFLLMLSDREVLAGVQSPTAVRILQERNCTVKFGKDLHAKILIADQRRAIVTSSNLTSRGLSGNAEMGVWIDDPEIVRALLRVFDHWYAKAGFISDTDLANLEALQRKSKSQTSGKRYGKYIQGGGVGLRQPSLSQTRLGWVLIHTKAKYGGKGQDARPQDQLTPFSPGMKWHWKLPSPMTEGGGPFRLLFAWPGWNGKIFGEASATVTRNIAKSMRKDYNFAFVLHAFRWNKPGIPLENLPLRKPGRHLIKLTNRILAAYDKMVNQNKR